MCFILIIFFITHIVNEINWRDIARLIFLSLSFCNLDYSPSNASNYKNFLDVEIKET